VTADPFREARAVADAVLLEGYVLYPYRASAKKNQARWQFGALAPVAFSATHPDESATLQCECLLDQATGATLTAQVRFLQAQTRRVQVRGAAGWTDVDRIDAGDRALVPWDEAVERQTERRVALADLPISWQEALEPAELAEPVSPDARLLRVRRPLRLQVSLAATVLGGPYGAIRLTVVVENLTAGDPGESRREIAMRDGLLGTHALLAVDRGRFLSLADPPEWARPAAADCVQRGAWPVLAGRDDRSLLVTPIILDDHPQIAPESPAPLYDGTEIDEILTLRTMALTDEEKREARGTDLRAAAVVDGVDHLPPEVLDRLHGTIRYLQEMERGVDPDTDEVFVAGARLAKGERVRLRPGIRGADAQDLFLAGRLATITGVFRDLDGGVHLAVTVDGDPLAELQAAHGRYRYFRPDEVEPLGALR
jgi:hypothetical protein